MRQETQWTTIFWEGWTALALCAAAVFWPGSAALGYPAVLWPGLALAAAVPVLCANIRLFLLSLTSCTSS